MTYVAPPTTTGALAGVQPLDEDVWSASLASCLADRMRAGRGAAVTWYNHASLLRVMDAGVDVRRFDLVGLDGLLLRRLVSPSLPRTSADLVLPLLLDRLPGCRVAIVGSTRSALDAAATVIEALPSRPVVVASYDGYGELLPPEAMAAQLRAAGAEVVVIGLGSPLQDSYLLTLVDCGLRSEILLTCGGWLDQVSNPAYYPAFAYRLKLNWLVRLVREPGRLWHRYTVEGLYAYRRRAALRHHLLELGCAPIAAMVRACSTDQPSQQSADRAAIPTAGGTARSTRQAA